jgi:catechol 2,3-dioxygenase-like lactoylglutathione lyase family enzyme
VAAVVSEGLLQFEGVIAYGTADADEAVHFFEHTLGLAPAAGGDVRFYPLAGDLALAVDTGGGYAGLPPYLLFSTHDIEGARDHFVRRGCEIADMAATDGDAVEGFFARAPEGHTVCIVARDALED